MTNWGHVGYSHLVLSMLPSISTAFFPAPRLSCAKLQCPFRHWHSAHATLVPSTQMSALPWVLQASQAFSQPTYTSGTATLCLFLPEAPPTASSPGAHCGVQCTPMLGSPPYLYVWHLSFTYHSCSEFLDHIHRYRSTPTYYRPLPVTTGPSTGPLHIPRYHSYYHPLLF